MDDSERVDATAGATRADAARDAPLALAALAGLLALLRRRGGTDELRDPVAVLGGVAGALAVEWAFLRYPDRLLSVWRRPGVAPAGALAVLAAGWRSRDSSRLVAAGVWGLLTYVGLLGATTVRSR